LRDIAINFHHTQQLRDRIAHVILPLLKPQYAAPQATAPVQTDCDIFPIILALARCGIAHEPTNAAYVQQLKRLANALDGDQRAKIQGLIDWHNQGRKRGEVAIIQSEVAGKR
jgi:hypothetical protein